MSKTVETCTAIITTTRDDEKQIVVVPKRKHGLNLLRVALYMIRGKSNKKKPVPAAAVEEVAPKGMWNKVVGSMRPLHLQHNNNASPIAASALPDSPIVGDYKDVFPPPISPNGPFHATLSPSSSEDGMSSRYASTVNLQELDKSEDNQQVAVVVKQEDEMIDAKADEFIARFYEQMRLQRLDSINLRYSEMNARALGWGA